MPTKIWPVSHIYYPLDHRIDSDAVVNKYGAGFEQRITTDYPRGPRADGEGGVTTYIGTSTFSLNINNMRLSGGRHPTNADIENSIRKLWSFYKSCFYDPVTGRIGWDAFFFYNPNENDDYTTWTGETPSAGSNSKGEAVTNLTGRYLVRFMEPNMSISRFKTCFFNSSMELVEVAA